MKKLIWQIIKFGGVGGLSFVIDFAVLWLCHDLLSVEILFSTAVAFIVSWVINYILSVKVVFVVSEKHSETRNFILFVIFSVIGLVLTEFLMHWGVNILRLNYMLVKILATAVVMVFNFITRKIFLEH